MTAHGARPASTDALLRASDSGDRALILMYHRVADVAPDPWGLCVTPGHFAEHLAVLRSCSRPARLQELSDALATGTLPDQMVVITFDDGYADNLHSAKPLLDRYEVPATVFVASGYVGESREFWWDELERSVLHSRELPATLDLTIGKVPYHRDLAASNYNSTCGRSPWVDWRAWDTPPDARASLYRALWDLLQPLPEDERLEAQQQLRNWAGTESAARPTHRPLSRDEVVSLASGDLIEIGAHTVTHPLLTALVPDAQVQEIQKSRDDLEAIVGHAVTQFSYPYGGYADDTLSIVQRTGFTCACSTKAGMVQRTADRFQLPRVQVHDWDGEQFAKWFSRVQCGD